MSSIRQIRAATQMFGKTVKDRLIKTSRETDRYMDERWSATLSIGTRPRGLAALKVRCHLIKVYSLSDSYCAHFAYHGLGVLNLDIAAQPKRAILGTPFHRTKFLSLLTKLREIEIDVVMFTLWPSSTCSFGRVTGAQRRAFRKRLQIATTRS